MILELLRFNAFEIVKSNVSFLNSLQILDPP